MKNNIQTINNHNYDLISGGFELCYCYPSDSISEPDPSEPYYDISEYECMRMCCNNGGLSHYRYINSHLYIFREESCFGAEQVNINVLDGMYENKFYMSAT